MKYQFDKNKKSSQGNGFVNNFYKYWRLIQKNIIIFCVQKLKKVLYTNRLAEKIAAKINKNDDDVDDVSAFVKH